MRKGIFIVLSATVASLLLTGCVGSAPDIPYQTYKFEKSDYKLPIADFYVNNGALELSNGEKIMDADGDIIYAHKTNSKIFYLVKKRSDNVEFVVKDVGGKYVKELKANMLKFYNDGFLAARLNTHDTAIFDNIWKISDDGLKLVGKNLRLNGIVSGRYDIEIIRRYTKYGSYIDGYHITDVPTGKVIHSDYDDYKKTLIFPNQRSKSFKVVGSSRDNLLAIYNDTMGKLALGAYNVTTGFSATIANAETIKGPIQILECGGDKILRVFENQKLKYESKTIINGSSIDTRDSMVTTYNNEPSKFFNLSTLKEVSLKEPWKCSNIKATNVWENLGGGRNTTYYITYGFTDIFNYYDESGVLPLDPMQKSDQSLLVKEYE